MADVVEETDEIFEVADAESDDVFDTVDDPDADLELELRLEGETRLELLLLRLDVFGHKFPVQDVVRVWN